MTSTIFFYLEQQSGKMASDIKAEVCHYIHPPRKNEKLSAFEIHLQRPNSRCEHSEVVDNVLDDVSVKSCSIQISTHANNYGKMFVTENSIECYWAQL